MTSRLLLASLAIVSFLSPGQAWAMQKALPEVIERMRDEGRLDAFLQMSAERLAQERGRAGDMSMAADAPDSMHTLVLLVDFPDIQADPVEHGPAHYEELLYSEGVMSTGSARDIFIENSYGKFDFTGDVAAAWYRMEHPCAGWYCNADGIPGTNDDHGFCCGSVQSFQGLMRDLIAAADPDIDFSRYDNDDDGDVDGIFIVHGGPGAESTGDPNHIWSHRSSVNIQTQDGVRIRDYSTEPETGTVGVFVHEFGHVLGLPDLYDTDYSSNGVGNWSIMAGGSWLPNNQGTVPAHFDAWSKMRLGWVDPIVITPEDLSQNPFSIPRVEDNAVVYKLWNDGQPGNQYFLVENRQQVLGDRYIPGNGLVIWHIDDGTGGNSNEGMDPMNVSPHYRVTLEEADCLEHAWPYWESDGVPGSFGLETDVSSGDPGDPFPGRTDNRAFHSGTWPNSNAYVQTETDVAIFEISDSADTMTAVFDVSRVIPLLGVSQVTSDDGGGGDGDGRGEAGETIDLVVTLRNEWGDAPGLSVTLSTEDSFVSVSDNQGDFGDLDGGEEGSNVSDPFTLTISPELDGARRVPLTLAVTAYPLGREYTTEVDAELIVGWPRVLLVDDDGEEESEVVLRSDLAAAGFDTWDEWSVADGSGTVRNPFRAGNPVIVWLTGDQGEGTLTESDQDSLARVLDTGVNLVLSGQEIDSDIGGTDFFRDWLHAAPLSENTGEGAVRGVADHPVTGGFVDRPMIMVQRSPSSLEALDGAEEALHYYGAGDAAAVSYDGNPPGSGHKVITIGFDMSLIQNDAERIDLLQALVSWDATVGFAGGDVPRVNRPEPFVLEPNAPNPFNPITTIRYALHRPGAVTLRVYDMTGALVRTLLDEEQVPGAHSVQWDGRDERGAAVASGAYLYRLATPGSSVTRRMVLLK